MARILCAKSGIDLKVEHFPVYLTSRECQHPVFDMNTTALLSYQEQWLDGSLTPIENYLYYLALFNSTNLVEFRVPATRTQFTDSIIANNMHSLINILTDIEDIGTSRVHTKLNLPRFVITPDTKDLSNTKYWLENWKANWDDYCSGYKTVTAIEKLTRQENILERLIKDKTKDVTQYANRLADWAADAGEFDIHANYLVLNEYDKPERMAEYWKRIIRACAKTESIFEIPNIDLTDLIEHCEETIHHGSIYAASLMTLLRAGAERKRNFLDLGDIDIGNNGSVTFRILDANSSIEDANKLALIDSAPNEKPIESNYPNKLAFLRAKMKYDMATEYRNSSKEIAIDNRTNVDRRTES